MRECVSELIIYVSFTHIKHIIYISIIKILPIFKKNIKYIHVLHGYVNENHSRSMRGFFYRYKIYRKKIINKTVCI